MVVSGRTLGTIQFSCVSSFSPSKHSDLSLRPILLELSSESRRVRHSWPNARKHKGFKSEYTISKMVERDKKREIAHDWKRTIRNRRISPAASQHLIRLKFTANWIQVPHANVFSWCGRAASSTWGSLIARLPSLQHAPSIMRLLATWLQIFPLALRALAHQRLQSSSCADRLLFGEEHSAYLMAYAAAKHTWSPETALFIEIMRRMNSTSIVVKKTQPMLRVMNTFNKTTMKRAIRSGRASKTSWKHRNPRKLKIEKRSIPPSFFHPSSAKEGFILWFFGVESRHPSQRCHNLKIDSQPATYWKMSVKEFPKYPPWN